MVYNQYLRSCKQIMRNNYTYIFYTQQYLNLSMQKFSKVKLEDEYVVDMNNVLGKGSTGCVYEGYDERTKAKVAVKVIELSTIDNEVTEYLLRMQKRALMSLCSPFVLKGLRIFQDNRFCFMVTEFCNGGTLKKFIKDKGFLSQETSLKIVKQILQGYKNLVDHKVVHRDLKPANIMMNNDCPKIIDFGYCEIQGYQKPKLEYNVGSPSYMAPESYHLNIYNEKTQIWSIGVILYECLTGKTIDQGVKMTEIYKLLEKKGVPYPDHVSQYCRDIVNWCLRKDPWTRPTCTELLKTYFNPTNTKNSGIINKSSLHIPQNKDRLTQKTIDSERSSKKLPITLSTIISSQSIEQMNKIEVLNNNYAKVSIERQKNSPVFVNSIDGVQNRVKTSFSVYEKTNKVENVQTDYQKVVEGFVKQDRRISHYQPNFGHTVNLSKQNIVNQNNMMAMRQTQHFPHQVYSHRPNFPVQPTTMNNECPYQLQTPIRQIPIKTIKAIERPITSTFYNYGQRQRTVSFRI